MTRCGSTDPNHETRMQGVYPEGGGFIFRGYGLDPRERRGPNWGKTNKQCCDPQVEGAHM